MTYSTPKPLPDTPSSPVLHRLTTDSNALISTFIRHIVYEKGLDGSWIDVIKSCLVDFGEYVESGQILTGLKATRRAQSFARALADAAMREHRRKEREPLKESKVGKSKAYDKEKAEVADTGISAAMAEVHVNLREIHALTSIVTTPSSTASPKHLFLTVSPPLDTLPDADMEFNIIPTSQACTFSAETFSFPFYSDGGGRHGEGGIVIYGLDNWLSHSPEESLQIVGGTFTFRSIGSGPVYESLTTILKLSIYTYMSLILEQHLLSNFSVMLQYPKPTPTLLTSTPFIYSVTLTPSPTRKPRPNKSSSGIWSFLSKKTEGIIHRVTGTNSEGVDGAPPRASSIDLGSVFLSSKPSRRAQPATEENEEDVRLIAEMEPVSNTMKASPAHIAEEEEQKDGERFGPFTSTVRRVQDRHCILSTSPNVNFPLPLLIARLAQREEEQRQRHASSSSESSLSSSISSMTIPVPGSVHGPPNLRLTGVEKTGLGSVLGWEGQEARGRGMAGIRSFVRHQGLVVLYAEHRQLGEEMHSCGRPRWVTFRYWSRRPAVDADRDQTLGEFVERFCDATMTEERCETEGCDTPRGRHCMSWTCGGVKVRATLKDNAEVPDAEDDVQIWQTCDVCGKMTEQLKMDSGTYLFSFAKYLELLIWSPSISCLSLCDHIASSSPLSQAGYPPLSSSRFHILRHFAHKRRILTFALTPIHNDIYELRLPKFQIISGSVPREERNLCEARKKQEGEEERLNLSTEINVWWQEIKVRLDRLEDFLEIEAMEAMHSKDLPPLPSSDDEDSEDEAVPSRSHSPLPRNPPNFRSISLAHSTAEHLTSLLPEKAKIDKPTAPYPPGLPISTGQSRRLLESLRASFLTTENTLRKQIQDIPVSSLNDVRRAFRSTAQGIWKRLAAWQKKHVPGAPVDILGDTRHNEPEWWNVTCHTVPGGRVVVREGEWGSVIAFTLSSLDYQRELANLNAVPALASSPALSVTSEFRSASPNATIKGNKFTVKTPDPDENDTKSWEESEPCTTVITRREHPREVSLLSLRDVLRTKPSFDSSSLGSRFSGSLSRGIANFTPPSAWAQPQVQVNLQAAGGQVSHFLEATEVVEKISESRYHIHHADITSDSDYTFSAIDGGDVTPTQSSFVESHIRRGRASPIISVDNPTENDLGGQGFVPIMAPQPLVPTTWIPVPGSLKQQDTYPTGSSFTGALSNAMRYFLSSGSGSPSRGHSPVQQGPHHGLLTRDTTSIDDRPHIKYDWTIGKRLKFSCTVYYAKQFDVLRKRCGVDDIVIKSLERSENWTAIGGKSKSNFWKSSDDRFIIKTLVNAWNVADLQVLIELAPSYFRYIDSTANKASALAKLMGFYTVEVKNLETGAVQAKHDLLVMENLFYDQKVARTFDLKGIQSRRVKLGNGGTERRTLFDGEWIEGQQRAPLLIQPHSGHILHEAIKADAEFLAKSNIMDYSLLLGVDDERHEISCGLVDTIGSYTFAKTLEYKAKQNLNSGKGKEVTVIPPAEYHTRFVNSIENYFLTCPDKWTRPSPFIDRTSANDLPSVV